MDEKKLDELWKILSSATNIENLEYDEAVIIGSVFGEMKGKILKYENALNFGIKYLESSDISQVQLVRNALKEALDS